MAPDGGNIRVVVRVRPFNNREKDRKARCIVSMKDNQTILTPLAPEGAKVKATKAAQTFAFDKSYWSFDRKDDAEFAGQEGVFLDLGKPLLDNAFQGYNNCIFAYGQTGSGKSYSMMGFGEEYGVIPRICKEMFERIDILRVQEDNVTSTVEVSYLEIYNERVRDLLNPANKGNLRVREHPATGPYVEDLAKLVVRDFVEIGNLMDEGNKARTVAATNMNETSSRSHAVFTLTLTQRRHDDETNMDSEKVAKISLVDLAGSERATSTGATGARLKEGAEINRSLSTLGRVIATLADMSDPKVRKAKGAQVPYRDSVLTWLLKDSLGGNSLTAMIAAISPADINYEETLSTLRYADSAKRIKNHAVVNEDPNARMIRELKEELAQLRARLGGSTTLAPTEDQYPPETPLSQQFVTITAPDGSTTRVSKASIAEQLSQSEKLYSSLNQTWEQKLATTERIHKEREAALEELGISIERGNVGLSTPKRMPHLVNLSDDMLLEGCLLYQLKPGTTTLGNVESNVHAESGGEQGQHDHNAEANGAHGHHHQQPDILLNGSKILHDHCTFENVDGLITVIPKEGAAVMVNGLRIDGPARLRSGDRVILGDFHIFRFNHPQEARQEERERTLTLANETERGSRLKYSYTADEMDDTPSKRPSHTHYERQSSNLSRPMSPENDSSPASGTVSPAAWRLSGAGRDSDWAFARREAASSILGLGGLGTAQMSERTIAAMTDDELDGLYEDLQRVRAVRKARPESRMVGADDYAGDTDVESASVSASMSSPRPMAWREKYLSNGTLDDFSLDTARTTPSLVAEEDAGQEMGVEAVQATKAENNTALLEHLQQERLKMDRDLAEIKESFQRQLDTQRKEHEKDMARITSSGRPPTTNGESSLSERDVYLAKWVLSHWQSQRYVFMSAEILRNAALLKEAQVLSQTMDREMVFQFTILDVGYTLASSYDLVLNGIADEESDDLDLLTARMPCVGVRIIDFRNSVVRLWNLQKLRVRVKRMRTLQHPSASDANTAANATPSTSPFDDLSSPHYTRIGDADIPLTAVFACRVQDFTLDVYSPYTCSVIGILRLSLEPSTAFAPSSTLKFNVVMHDFVGFAEREGTDVHAQLFVPGISDAERGGVTTTLLVNGFGEGPVKFESVHSMSLDAHADREAVLRVALYAKVEAVHLDKLLSWDDMRDSSERSLANRKSSDRSQGRSRHSRQASRLSEREFFKEERYDVFARLWVQEIDEEGSYAPVEVVQASTLDQGAYQLRQGLQRRLVLTIEHSSGDSLPWNAVVGISAVYAPLDEKAADSSTDTAKSKAVEVPLQLVSAPNFATSSDGTTVAIVTAQWDTSAHNTPDLNRPTLDDRRTPLCLIIRLSSPKLAQAASFSFPFAVATRPRTWFRQNSLLAQLWHNQRVVHSTAANFAVTVMPAAVKRTGDLWRLDSSGVFVGGEESLVGWKPRGVSLLKDFLVGRDKARKGRDAEAARGWAGYAGFNGGLRANVAEDSKLDERGHQLLAKSLALWKTKIYSAADAAILNSNFSSPRPSTTAMASLTNSDQPRKPTPLAAQIDHLSKTTHSTKSGWLLLPDSAGTKWRKHYTELRRPFLHLYASTGDEIAAINLTNCRIDSEPEITKLLRRPRTAMAVWALYAVGRAWIFGCRGEKERAEWIWAVDRLFGGNSTGSGSRSRDWSDGEDEMD